MGDRIGSSCASPATVAILTAILDGLGEPITVLVASCDFHRQGITRWLAEQAIAEGIVVPIALLDDPAFVAELIGEHGGVYELAQVAV
jgi:hypothetical protein